MSRIIDLKLNELTSLIYKMGDLAYQAVSMAIEESLNGGCLYDKIVEISDMLIMLAEQVEDEAFEIIVRFQPVASDLRIIKSYIKISYDFTRFGRYALDISYVNRYFGGLKDGEGWVRSYVVDMSGKVLYMMKVGMDALRNQKVGLARSVSEIEKDIDELYFNFLDKIIGEKNIDSRIIISSVLIIRYLERVADHAAYVCESIIYALTGKKEFLR